ncbi:MULTISPECIES: hypothetical protein [Sphingobacterium]|uniref:hypothetical protein n=1 Tax=Sphingobacterium TaxID=28453 RepID=UPI00038A4ABE|nr:MULTISPECIES: hypothetical protein [unclassified Sphingobacterium]KKX47297.1 hypothetical protein L950_0227230 [Sphingobacterium sp. IITKGP-BTPF85]QQD12191.1 hypothetical protein JAZ75_16415 [Sphingobacterium sp. UDSM-2020]
MKNDVEIKARLLPYFFLRLKELGIQCCSHEQELIASIQVHYLKPGQRLEHPQASLFFLVHGLIKEYHRTKRSIEPSSLIQLLTPDTCWIYDQIYFRFYTKALAPTWLLEIPLDKLHMISTDVAEFNQWRANIDLLYGSKHFLSEFLRQLSDRHERLHYFLEEYAPYIDYLSDNEIAVFTNLSDAQLRRLRNTAVLYKTLD